MQQNTDFIEPKNFSSSPIKKTFDYYNTQGNLWDSKYLSSKKISKYYQTFSWGRTVLGGIRNCN